MERLHNWLHASTGPAEGRTASKAEKRVSEAWSPSVELQTFAPDGVYIGSHRDTASSLAALSPDFPRLPPISSFEYGNHMAPGNGNDLPSQNSTIGSRMPFRENFPHGFSSPLVCASTNWNPFADPNPQLDNPVFDSRSGWGPIGTPYDDHLAPMHNTTSPQTQFSPPGALNLHSGLFDLRGNANDRPQVNVPGAFSFSSPFNFPGTNAWTLQDETALRQRELDLLNRVHRSKSQVLGEWNPASGIMSDVRSLRDELARTRRIRQGKLYDDSDISSLGSEPPLRVSQRLHDKVHGKRTANEREDEEQYAMLGRLGLEVGLAALTKQKDRTGGPGSEYRLSNEDVDHAAICELLNQWLKVATSRVEASRRVPLPDKAPPRVLRSHVASTQRKSKRVSREENRGNLYYHGI